MESDGCDASGRIEVFYVTDWSEVGRALLIAIVAFVAAMLVIHDDSLKRRALNFGVAGIILAALLSAKALRSLTYPRPILVLDATTMAWRALWESKYHEVEWPEIKHVSLESPTRGSQALRLVLQSNPLTSLGLSGGKDALVMADGLSLTPHELLRIIRARSSVTNYAALR